MARLKSGKQSRTFDLVGMTPADFKSYIERKMLPRMTWENYGKAWHIDHIIPLSSFDLRDERQLRAAMHFSNLRPLWAKANLRKGGKVENPQLGLLIDA